MPVHQFSYIELSSDKELDNDDYHLLSEAKRITENAYAPYSNFKVGCAVQLQNGEIILGVNIENASYPVGICAERSALSSALSQFPDETISAIAISYFSPQGENTQPAFPCGMCRQFISECEHKNKQNIKLIMAAQLGKVYIIDTVQHLLPFSFSKIDLK
ncbi:MAG: cytidine deaminase [Bacteroidetes bacterium]|jgi:cytidine deaminase|nr:cytidine deaminase [Bacteroidota bacterium]HMT34574.1 cytidine deaminase [Chitinophagaceae bacterium]MBK6818223.1 cytidine deaminase [Bacteroidota bacterium]MBK7040560.1 cytidine deaminase [Bacteroidota bacterium]MBK7589619.1 cytidine deaminase [Bacteroidota bacterium]